jgi:transposase
MAAMLFDKGPSEKPSGSDLGEKSHASPRLRIPHRNQVEMHWAALDELLEPDHPARIVWASVCELDLSRWLRKIKAIEGHVGRDGTDPRLLVALWVYATLEAVGSARELARLCEKHLAFKWLCGGVTVNHHMLSDFRTENREAWEELLTQIVASLLAGNLVTMKRVAQDGMRVRANAGKASFRRRPRLGQFLEDVREQVKTLTALADENPDELSQRQRSARERAAEERATRIQEAIRNCEELQKEREERAKITGRPPKEARASTTDPEARVIQFSDNGFRPGFNIQYATDVDSGIIVGVDANNAGNDNEQLLPMLDQLQERYGKVPDEALIDGGFSNHDAIEQAADRGCLVYSPPKEEQKQLDAGKDPYAPKKGDAPAVAAWRARMGTAAAKVIYRLRAQSAEWVNAMARNRGLWQMPVRGQSKCRTVATIYAIAHNLMRATKLQRAT